MPPRGILRNKDEATKHPFEEQLDRQEVVRNTILNSQPQQVERPDQSLPVVQGNDHLKWDEINLYKTEQEKAATMKIDEPKTPYEGGFNPQGEYYQQDEVDGDDDIPQFELGEGEATQNIQLLNGGEVLPLEEMEEEEEEEEERPLTAEERHKRFEEMRKKHYHLKANPLHQDYDYTKEPEV